MIGASLQTNFIKKESYVKQKLKLEASKPRNPYVMLLRFKKSGVHQKSNKALRRAEKVKFKGEAL